VDQPAFLLRCEDPVGQRLQVRGQLGQHADQPCAAGQGSSHLGRPRGLEVLDQRVEQWREGFLPATALASAHQDRPASRDGLLCGGLQQPGFTDARLTGEEQHRLGSKRLATPDQDPAQQGKLAIAPHHRHQDIGGERGCCLTGRRAGRGQQGGAIRSTQSHGGGQHIHRAKVGGAPHAAFQGADGHRRYPSALGQRLLG